MECSFLPITSRPTPGPAPDRIAIRRRLVRLLRTALLTTLLAAEPSFAALSPEIIDKAATILAFVIIVAVPIGGITLFWIVHVLPEKIAEKRHHPQKDAIHVLCLLSLVFGGLLWPLAWLWTYTKPVLHKAAYGRDKHDDFFKEIGEEAAAGISTATVIEEATRLRNELDVLAGRGELTPAMKDLRQQLAGLAAEPAADQTVGEKA